MKIIVFNDYCCLGNCSLKVNISVLMQNKIEVVAIPTKIFSSHMGYEHFVSFKMPNFLKIKESIEKNIKDFDLIYIGYVDEMNQFEIIEKYIEKSKKNFVLDPILGDDGKKYSKITTNQILFYKKLLKFHPVITPNLTEAVLLTDYKKSYLELKKQDVIEMAKKLFEMGAKEVIIKGFEENKKLYTLYFIENEMKFFSIDKIDTSICGTGDAFSSLIALEILRKNNIKNSIDKIQKLLFEQIKTQQLHQGLNEISIEKLKLK